MKYITFCVLALLFAYSALASPSGFMFSIVQERVPGNIPRKGPKALRRTHAEYEILPSESLVRGSQQGSVTTDPYAHSMTEKPLLKTSTSCPTISVPPQKLLISGHWKHQVFRTRPVHSKPSNGPMSIVSYLYRCHIGLAN